MRDFFISFSSADRVWAEWIAWELQDAGYTVELQGWTWGAGANFKSEMDRALRESRATLAVLSPSYLESPFTRMEWTAAERLLPVKVRPCEPSGLLGSVAFIDLVGKDETDARNALIDGVKPPGDWLLIFDNAEDPPTLHRYLPRGRTGPVLVTSRRRDWDDVATPFEISVLPAEDAHEHRWSEAAVTLLLARYGYDEDDPATWAPALRLLPHVAAATAAAEALGADHPTTRTIAGNLANLC